MIKKPIILVAALISLVIGIFIFFPSSENSDIILPLHLRCLKGLIGVTASFFEFNDKIGP